MEPTLFLVQHMVEDLLEHQPKHLPSHGVHLTLHSRHIKDSAPKCSVMLLGHGPPDQALVAVLVAVQDLVTALVAALALVSITCPREGTPIFPNSELTHRNSI